MKFSTPSVSTALAEAVVDVRINNVDKAKKKVKLIADLFSPGGKLVASASDEVVAGAGNTRSRLQFLLKNPELWSPESPVLYELRTSIRVEGKEIDKVVETVGFRYMNFDSDSGFFLNGKSIKLKGVCFHDDAGALGSAVPEGVWERRLKSLKEMGCNALRMSHNPHQDYIYDLCDRMGFLVQDEAFDEWEIGKKKWIAGWNVGTPGKDGYNKVFNEWFERDLADMVLRNQNRVSIIMWSIGNEIDYPNDPYTHEVLNTGRNPQIYGKGHQAGNPPAQRLGELSKRLVKVVKSVDTTRFVTAALAGVVMSNTTEYPESLDVVGYNYQEYRYADDHARYPKRIIYGSENGKSYDAWAAVSDNLFISGQFLWTAFDFLGEARSWPSRSSGAGLIDMAGFHKPQFYQRKSWWTTEPMIYAAVSSKFSDGGRRNFELKSHWNWSEGDSVSVVVFTNLPEAELLLNGKSLGKKQNSAGSNELRWDVIYAPGKLQAIGSSGGKIVATHDVLTAGAPSRIVAAQDKKVLAGTMDVAHLEINIVDDHDIVVGTADSEVTIEIEGPGKLIGLESGSLSSHEDYKSNKRKCRDGKLLAYVQATGKGIVKVKVTSPALKSQEIQIKAE